MSVRQSEDRTRRSVAPIVLAVVLVLAACGAAGVYLIGRGTTAGRAAPAGAGHESDGDNFAWDPCGYLTPEMYADLAERDKSGRPRLQIKPHDFDTCEVSVDLPDSPRLLTVVVSKSQRGTGDLAHDDRYTVRDEGNWKVAEERTAKPGECARVVYAAESSFSIRSHAERPTGDRADPCPAADRATRALLTVLHTGTIGKLDFPPDSQGRVDLCAALTDADVTAAVEFPGRRADRPGHRAAHECGRRSAADDGRRAEVLFRTHLDVAPPRSSGPDDTRTTIAGRDTVIHRITTVRTACVAVLAGRTWPSWPGNQLFQLDYPAPKELVENASLLVETPTGNMEEACRAAEALAAKAWPRMP
ncbi:hypothetical protein [Nocardia blacklockiae]|uniref:hypothetical protein n=1 Tax=Nocardia blacklockiae TaxID=480036 RepID=UPI001892F8D6|nr:hypothetical protein [Nocardia blacklockiae]MBF6170449.1 hypothetical protein [Nocardia blacklockiae]